MAGRRRLAARLLLGLVALSATEPGLWATFAPESFYRSFPLGGHGWVALAGPPSAHLTADAGAFYLAFALLFAWAAVRPDRALVLPLCLAWSLFSVLHFGWHLAHLEPFSAGAALAQMVSLGLALAAPLWAAALLVERRSPAGPGGLAA